MRSALLLARLNDLDLVLDGLSARLAEIADALKEPASLRAARRALVEAGTALSQAQALQACCETAQREAAGHLARAEGKLYGGTMRNPKELTDAEKDVQQLHRQLARAEDALLDALVAVETATEGHNRQRAAVETLSADWMATQGNLLAERARLQERLPLDQARQAAARRSVPAGLLPTYDELRSRRAGRAVAALDGETCSACRVAVSPTKLDAACFGEELTFCENCGRVLWGE